MNETNTSWLTASGTATINGYSGINTTTMTDGSLLAISGNSTINYSSLTIANSNNMVKQVKVAVFTVERNEDNKVTSAKLIKELWVEVKNGTSLDLAVAKELDKDFDPSTTVIREIISVTF
jgi:thiamine pyrophosphate-dependent acetolactate synthase large subunit-like protein